MSKPMRGAFTGTVLKGRFQSDNPDRLRELWKNREGLRTRIEIGPIPRFRTDPQLAYYWAGIIRPIAEWSGHDEEEIHDYLKQQVLRPLLQRKLWLPMPDGTHIAAQPSTGPLTVDEMNEYIGKCKRFAETKWPELEIPDIDHVPVR